MYFTENHEWVKIEGSSASIGITNHAIKELGDIVFIELPCEGEEFEKGDEFGVVESVKAASDIFMPIAGIITEVNETLEDQPDSLTGETFIIKVFGDFDTEDLMSEDEYLKFIKE